MGSSATVAGGLPPLPAGATLNTAPAQPSASTGGLPPLPPGATMSATPSTPAAATPAAAPAAPPAPPALTQNPNGEGTYQMTSTRDGSPIQVPYSRVPQAMQQGYGMDLNGDGQRYTKDRAADPNTSNLSDAAHAVLSIPGDVAHGLKLWLPNPKEVLKGQVKHEAEIPQAVAGWFGGDEAKRGMRNLENRILPGSGNPASNSDQERGANMASVEEYAAGEKVLSKLAETLVPMAEGANYADKLKNAQPIIKAAAAHPRIARVLAAGLSQGALGGGQAALHGASAGDTALAAGVGAGIGTVAEGVPEAIAQIGQTRGPVAETIAGETVPTLSSQQPGTGPRGDVTASEVPKFAAQQQAAAPRVFRSVAQRATKQALDTANEGRVIPGQITDPARMLPAPADAKPYAFTIPGTGTAENTVGEMAQPAAKAPQAAFKQPAYVTSSAPRPAVAGVEGSTGADIATNTPATPARDVVTGGGDLVTASPETAQMHLSRLNDLIDHPPAGMAPEQLQQITSARDNLQDQMDMYNAHQRTAPNFAPIDSARAAAGVGHFGEAQDQLQQAAQPIYQKIDADTDGEFGRLNKLRAAAAKRGDFEAKYGYEDQIDKLITDSGAITPAERTQATKLWSTSKVLGGFDDIVNNAANVDDAYASQVTGGRTLSGTKLQNGLQRMIKQYGADRLESVVGKDGMENMTRMADLLKTPGKQSAVKQLSLNIYHNLAHGKVGAAIGIAVGHQLGGYEGAAAGAMTGANAERMVLRYIATNPRVGQLFEYAVRNDVTPKVAAALVAAEIEREQAQDKPQTDNGGTQ